MKNYKDFERIYVGFSDVAALTVQACADDEVIAFPILFGSDGGYVAYLVDDSAKIGEHYRLVKTVKMCSWFNIFDDARKTFHFRFNWGKKENVLKIWRAGEYGIVLQICKEGE